jgi:ParB/RepB/Spo0J family partition protein
MELEFHQMAMKYEGLRISMPGLQARLTVSLAAEGQLQPVLVVQSEAAGYVLIDGYRRVSALRTLGRDTVEAMALPLDEPAALIFHHCQENAHQRSALEDGWLLRELLELHGMSQEDMSRFLQRSRSWVSRRLSLVRELPESVQDLVRQGKLCGHSAMKYLVPLARAKKTDCEELVGNLGGKRISVRQMEKIYVAWKSGDAEQRRKVVQRPLLFLKTAEELRSEPPKQVGDEIAKVLDDMEILDAVSGRARRRIRGLRAGVPLPDTVIEGWRVAQSSFSALSGAMERRVNAGHGDKNGDSAPQS